MRQFVILNRSNEWHPTELVAIVEAETADAALAIVRPYITAPGDNEDDSRDYTASPLESWLYDSTTNRVGRG